MKRTSALLLAVVVAAALPAWGSLSSAGVLHLRQSDPSAASSSVSSPAYSESESERIPVTLTIGTQRFSADLYDSETTRALAERFPLTVEMSELNGNEKYYYMDDPLPAEPAPTEKINAGDIMLYGEDCLVIFYESFSSGYRYTNLGRAEEPEKLSDALGTGDVTVRFEEREP